MHILIYMAKYIPDIQSHRWVILAPGRLSKPKTAEKDYQLKQKNGLNYSPDCPFCPGNEHLTPDEIDSIKKDDSWLVRTFSNKYPITDIHEVIVHHRDHKKDIEDFSDKEIFDLITMYQKRINDLSKKGATILFRNKGFKAGTSIHHPHSQIILLPEQINLESLSLEPIKNIIMENESFLLYCPDFSQYPYEIWIVHKSCKGKELGQEALKEIRFTHFVEKELLHLGLLLQKSLRALTKQLGDFSYNYYISPKPPFYLRIIPRLLTRGGFELGTGLSTNVVDPVSAAEELKKHIK